MLKNMKNSENEISEFENYYSMHGEYAKLDEHAFQGKVFTIGEIFKKIQKNEKSLKILDLGCGDGALAYFCAKNGYSNYYGVDICEYFIKINKNKYPDLSFEFINAFDFLSSNTEKFDIVFMAHVFEHFDMEAGEKLLDLIENNLNEGGILINVMPNAASIFGACEMRFKDITHKLIYTDVSFSQLLSKTNFKNIIHMNKVVGQTKLRFVVHKIVLFFYKLLMGSMGNTFPKIYTNEIITIAKK